MHVEDGVGIGVEKFVTEDAVVSRAHNQAHAERLEPLMDLPIPGRGIATEVGLGQGHRGDAPAAGDVERVSAAPVRDDECDARRKVGILAHLEQRVEVGPSSRHQHPDEGTCAHRRMTRRVPD